MPVWVHIELAIQFVDFFLKLSSKRADTASKAVHDGMRNFVLFYVSTTLIQSVDIVKNGLGGTDVWHFYLETTSIVVFELAIFFGLARHMVFKTRVILVIFRQLIDKCFVSTISARNALATNYENMLNVH